MLKGVPPYISEMRMNVLSFETMHLLPAYAFNICEMLMNAFAPNTAFKERVIVW